MEVYARRLEELQSRISGLDTQVSDIQDGIQHQISSIRAGIEESLRQQDRLAERVDYQYGDYNPADSSLGLTVRLLMRQYQPGTTGMLVLSCPGEQTVSLPMEGTKAAVFLFRPGGPLGQPFRRRGLHFARRYRAQRDPLGGIQLGGYVPADGAAGDRRVHLYTLGRQGEDGQLCGAVYRGQQLGYQSLSGAGVGGTVHRRQEAAGLAGGPGSVHGEGFHRPGGAEGIADQQADVYGGVTYYIYPEGQWDCPDGSQLELRAVVTDNLGQEYLVKENWQL